MRFIDANIFINWLRASKRNISMESAISGYIINMLLIGEEMLTTTLVKDEVLIWLSRYRARKLKEFMRLLREAHGLIIVAPTIKDEEFAVENHGKLPLGFSDLVNVSVMKRFKVREIYTNDKNFERLGFRVIFDEIVKTDEFQDFVRELRKRGYVVQLNNK